MIQSITHYVPNIEKIQAYLNTNEISFCRRLEPENDAPIGDLKFSNLRHFIAFAYNLNAEFKGYGFYTVNEEITAVANHNDRTLTATIITKVKKNRSERLYLLIDFHKYFDKAQTINIGSIIRKDKTYYEIKEIFLGWNGLKLHLQSLTSDIRKIKKYGSLGKLKVYERSPKLNKRINRKIEEKKIILQKVRASKGKLMVANVMKPRQTFGMQYRFIDHSILNKEEEEE